MPIFKSGNTFKIPNDIPIPISIHTYISKLFESLILRHTQPATNVILVDEEHEFRSDKFITACNIIFVNYIFNSFERYKQVDMIYTI